MFELSFRVILFRRRLSARLPATRSREMGKVNARDQRLQKCQKMTVLVAKKTNGSRSSSRARRTSQVHGEGLYRTASQEVPVSWH